MSHPEQVFVHLGIQALQEYSFNYSIKVMKNFELFSRGDSSKYPYHTTGGISYYEGELGFSDWSSEAMKRGGGKQFGIPNALGGSALNF